MRSRAAGRQTSVDIVAFPPRPADLSGIPTELPMASKTQKTEYRRKLRNAKAGKDRKRQQALHGTTPPFAIHTPEADANAPEEAKSSD